MQITETNAHNEHVLLQKCSKPVKAAVLSVACLTIWGLMFPMVLFAQVDSDRAAYEMKSSSTTLEYKKGEDRMEAKMERLQNKMEKVEEKKMMFRTKQQQKMAKQRVQGLVGNLTALQKQVATLSAQGVVVPATLTADIQKVIDGIKALSKSVETSPVGVVAPKEKPPVPRPSTETPAQPPVEPSTTTPSTTQ